jgi:hypothetical protein
MLVALASDCRPPPKLIGRHRGVLANHDRSGDHRRLSHTPMEKRVRQGDRNRDCRLAVPFFKPFLHSWLTRTGPATCRSFVTLAPSGPGIGAGITAGKGTRRPVPRAHGGSGRPCSGLYSCHPQAVNGYLRSKTRSVRGSDKTFFSERSYQEFAPRRSDGPWRKTCADERSRACHNNMLQRNLWRAHGLKGGASVPGFQKRMFSRSRKRRACADRFVSSPFPLK